MSYHDYTLNKGWNKKTLEYGIILLVLSPLVFLIELSIYQRAKELLKNPSHDTRLVKASYDILKNKQIRVVRINLPEEVLHFSRGLATSMSLNRTIQRDGELIKMWAVSRNAKEILIGRDVRYIDPMALPTSLKAGLTLPFDSAQLSNYLLIPQVLNY